MHAPTACILGLPAATSRSKKPARTGLNRTAVRVGRYRAFRSRAFPDLLSRVRPRTLAPLLNSRGDRPQYAAATSPGVVVQYRPEVPSCRSATTSACR